jgi:large subunit ribosomal protein LP0
MVTASKLEFETRVHDLLRSHKKALIVACDGVASKQMAEVRMALRGRATLLMGKNTLIKKCVRNYLDASGDDLWAPLLDLLVLNVGVLFVDADLAEVRQAVLSNTMPAAAKVGMVATVDVTIPAGNTGMDPAQTNFFQALNIPTKITKGCVEIIKDVELLKVGQKVESSAAALLAKLDIKPFEFALRPFTVFDEGSVYSTAVLDITDDAVLASARAAINNVAALSLGAGVPTAASVPHSIVAGFKNVVAVALGTDYSFPLADKVKENMAAAAAGGDAGAWAF